MITTTSSSKPYRIYIFKKTQFSLYTFSKRKKEGEKVNLILKTSNKRCLIKFQVDTIKADTVESL